MTIWRILTVAPQRELRVAGEIKRGLGLPTMVPTQRYKAKTRGRGNQVVLVDRVRPILPRYVFVGSDVGDVPFRDLLEIEHVQSLVQFGSEPALLSAADVHAIRRMAADLTTGWKTGDKVAILAGPFRSIEALISTVREQSVVVSVPILGSERDVEIRADQVERVG